MKLFTLLITSMVLSTLFGTKNTHAAEPKIENTRVKASVEKSLAYLAKQQQANGAWRIEKIGDSTAATSLAVLSFLAHGHVPGKGPHGERIQRGIDWVLSHQAKVAKTLGKKTGALLPPRKDHGFMYAHGMGTLMLAESLKHLNRRDGVRCRGALTRAVKLILLAQKVKKRVPGHEGGWRYLPSSESSDLSISTWQLKALYAAKAAGIKVPNASFTQALAFMGRCKSKDDDGFAYFPRSSSSTGRTAMALSCFVLFEKEKSKTSIAAANFLMSRPLRLQDKFFHYGAYPYAAAITQMGGKHQANLLPDMQKTILAGQLANGSWASKSSDKRYGNIHVTALSIMALSVELKQLSIHK